jgi:Icc-related predicted phosphoesterase
MTEAVPNGDMLLVAGDITNCGDLEDVNDFNDWLGTFPHKYKVVIAGNHDWCFQRQPMAAKAALTNAIYLEDEAITIDGLKIYGSPWQPEFCCWAFNLPRGEPLKNKWQQIPADTNILITHGPAFSMLDQVIGRYDHLGCEDLYNRIGELNNLRLHVCGHIHSGHGVKEHCGVIYANSSICTERYKPTYEPIVIEL